MSVWRGFITHNISIHSPHARGDVHTAYSLECIIFQSTPLMRGETGASGKNLLMTCKFQSTPLMRGETVVKRDCPPALEISIPLPSCEGRPRRTAEAPAGQQFQSTPLMRGETKSIKSFATRLIFQSTPLMRGETADWKKSLDDVQISIHSPHARGDYVFVYRWTG